MDGNRRRGGGAGEGEVDTNNDAAAGNGENEKGRSTDTRAESVLGTALLRLTGEAAAKKTEAEAREKESSSMADRLDLAVSEKCRYRDACHSRGASCFFCLVRVVT